MKKINYKKGQVLIISIIFLAVIMVLAASLFERVASFIRFGARSYLNEQATHLAEAGVDHTIWKLNQLAGSCNSTCTAETQVGTTGTFIVEIQDKTAQLKTITATGYVPNSTNPRAKRTIKVDLVIGGDTIAFKYAVQTGNGGLTMANSATINGNIYTNGSITGSGSSQISGDAYAVGTISTPDPFVTGNKYPGASPAPLPSIDTSDAETVAEAGGTTTCPCTISSNTSIGPRKYNGNLTISNNAVVTLQGPIWVTGNLVVSQGGTKVNLDESFGSVGTYVVVDGTVSISQGGQFNPTSANPKGYIMVVTKSTSSSAMSIANSGANAVFYALSGTANLSQTAQVNTLVANGLNMQNSATLNYDTGLASSSFSTGPGGGWQLRKGTYKFK